MMYSTCVPLSKNSFEGISSLAKASSNVPEGLSWPEWPIDAWHTAAIRVRFVPIRSESGHAVSQTQQFLRKFHLDSCCSLGSSEPHWAWVRMSNETSIKQRCKWGLFRDSKPVIDLHQCDQRSTGQFKFLLLQLGTIESPACIMHQIYYRYRYLDI